jgi:hypothetical protein
MGTTPVTHAEIVNAKPREKPYRLFDGRGLYLEVAFRWPLVAFQMGAGTILIRLMLRLSCSGGTER